MVVVVPDAIFVASRRAGRLNAANQAFGQQDAERIVDGLERNGPYLGPDDLGHAIG